MLASMTDAEARTAHTLLALARSSDADDALRGRMLDELETLTGSGRDAPFGTAVAELRAELAS